MSALRKRLAALTIALLGVGRLSAQDKKDPLPKDLATIKVVVTDLQPKIVERGSLEARDNYYVKSEVKHGSHGAPKLKWVVENGSLVKKGDPIVVLDDAALQEQATDQKIRFDKAKLEVEEAENHLQFKSAPFYRKIQVKSEEIALEDARLDLKKWDEGNADVWRKDVKSRLAQSEANLALWRERVLLAEQQFKEGKTTEAMLKAKRQKLEACGAEVERVKAEVLFVEKRSLPLQRKRLENQVDLAQHNLDAQRERESLRVKGDERAVKTAEEDLRIKRAVLVQQEALYMDLMNQIAQYKVNASNSGIVVYTVPEQTRMGSGSNQSIIAQGEPVQYGQILLSIPDLSHMLVRVRIDESFINLVKVGLPCEVRVDAIPGKRLKGIVKQVANEAEPPNRRSPDVKVYQTILEFTEPVQALNLKPGLSAACEIFTELRAERVLAVPIQAILKPSEKGKKPRCLIVTPGGAEAREVDLGRSDERMVEIKSGLKEGDEVVIDQRVLAPRPAK